MNRDFLKVILSGAGFARKTSLRSSLPQPEGCGPLPFTRPRAATVLPGEPCNRFFPILFIAAVAILMPVAAGAQSLGTTVEVTNSYEAGIPNLEKKALGASVPDSLYRYDARFDYSVFETPFKGSNDFTPYSVHIRPDASVSGRRNLRILAGAGYSFRPEFDLVWSPALKGKMGLSTYASFGGYVGEYNSIDPTDFSASGSYSSSDLAARAGVAGEWCLKKCEIDFDASYRGIYVPGGAYNSAVASASLRTFGKTGFKADFLYRVASDCAGSELAVSEQQILSDFSLLVYSKGRIGVYADASADILVYSPLGTRYLVGGAPRAEFNAGNFSADLSVQVQGGNHSEKSLYINPLAHVSFKMPRAHMSLFAEFERGASVRTYSQYKEENHFFSRELGDPSLDVLAMRAAAGIRGSIASRFRYELSGSLSDYSSLGLYGADGIKSVSACIARADLSLEYRKGPFRAEALLAVSGFTGDAPEAVFGPSLVSGSGTFEYTVRRRLTLALALAGATPRSLGAGSEPLLRVPGYVDLGFDARFKLNSRWSFFLKGRNLLGADIRRIPFISEKGLSFYWKKFLFLVYLREYIETN